MSVHHNCQHIQKKTFRRPNARNQASKWVCWEQTQECWNKCFLSLSVGHKTRHSLHWTKHIAKVFSASLWKMNTKLSQRTLKENPLRKPSEEAYFLIQCLQASDIKGGGLKFLNAWISINPPLPNTNRIFFLICKENNNINLVWEKQILP